MKKIVKTVLIMLACIVWVLLLPSCTDSSSDGSPDNDRDNIGEADENVVYSPDIKATLVLGEGVSARDVSLIRSAYHEAVGGELEICSSSSAASAHEIIVGKCERDISAKAYRALELISHDDGNVGYVIYSDGKSVALAFDGASLGENVARVSVVEAFVEMYMRGDTLKLDSGVAYYERFDPIEKQAKRDEEALQLLWELKLSQITEKTGGNEEAAQAIVYELKKLYGIYNVDYSVVEWLANLYDPVTGGFYYSNSARNNVGYLPDLESTSQALSIVELMLTGYGGTPTEYFGEEIAGKFVSFAKNMQDPNGYFYHPHWDRDLVDKNNTKRARDVVNALSILDLFGAAPIYDTPNGVKGEGALAPASKITVPLELSGVSAVSQLVSAEDDEIFIPGHLKTQQTFESYLSGLNIKADTLTVCEAIYAEIPLYLAIDEILEEEGASYRLTDVLETYLSRNQSSSTGLWSQGSADRYSEISELSSVIKLYNAIGAPVTNYRAILDTIVSAIESLDKPDEITDITSLWTSFYSVVNNLTTCSDETLIDDVTLRLKYVYSKFSGLISKTVSALSLFIKIDGSFSTTENASLSEVLGMPMALPGMDEGDMSATLLATKNLWLSIFGVLEVGSVPIFMASDRMMLQKTLRELGVIIKNEVKEVDPIDFEEYDVGTTPAVKHQFNSSESSINVVEDPVRGGNSARLYSPSSKGNKFDFFYFDIMSSVKNASCYSYEFDMCVLPDTSSGVFAQLYFYPDVHLISLSRSGDTVSFYENSSRTSSVTRTMDVGATAKIGEWFNLRVEYYPAPHGSVRIKIYFNDECIVVSDNYYGCEAAAPVPPTSFQNFCIYGYINQTMDVLMDNVAVEKSYQTYTVETGTLNRNVDYPEKTQTVHDFEKNNSGETPLTFMPSGERTGAAVRADADGNKLLAISENIGEIILPLDSRGSGINSALVEFDFTLSDNSESGAMYQISFNEYKYDNSVFGAMYLLIKEENGILYATLAERVSGAVGDSYQDVKLLVGEKHRISFYLFFNEGAIVVSVDDAVVGVNTNVANVSRYYLGEIKLISNTPSVDSEILIDNVIVEKAVQSFDEVTAPDVDRAVVGFDTTDGVELSGVSPQDGALSFEGVTDRASVKIPVNVRVSAPTMALVGFDVSASGSTGSLDIRLSDKSGNTIAAFVLASLGGKIYVYELTENGRYPTPIYTFTKTSFNFSFEYSERKGNFNLLVDGEYVTATSITYAWGSTAYDFEYLTVSSNGPSGFTLDNLYAEQISGIFKSHKISTPNLDPVNGVITYETSSFASMPSKIERILGNSTASHSIKEAKVNGAVSKVLEMNCGNGSASSYSIFSKTQNTSDSNAVFFESYVMLKATSSALDVKIELMSNSTMAYVLSITGKGVGEPLRALGKDLSVKEGEWFKLRVEYRDAPDDFNYDGLNDVVTRVYVNDEMIGERYVPYNVNSVVPTTSVSKVRVRNTSQRAGIYYFDNSIFGECNMRYVPPVPADTDTLTYEPGVVTNKTQASFGKTASKLTISTLTVSDKATKVLDFYTSANSYDKLTVTPTLTEEAANAVMLESDLMINPVSDTATLYLDPLTPAGNQPIRLTIVAQKDGDVTLYSENSAGVADPVIPDGLVIGKSGEWLKLKIEYMNPRVDYTGDKADDILCRIYVNGELVKTLYQPYKPGGFYDPAIISRQVLSATSETEANIYLDNTRFWLTKLEADEAPAQLPDIILGEGEAPNGGFDTDGWV